MNLQINPAHESYWREWENLFSLVSGNAYASFDTFRVLGHLLFFDNDTQVDFVLGDTLDTCAYNALQSGLKQGIAANLKELHIYNLQIFNKFKSENQQWIPRLLKNDNCFYEFFYGNHTYDDFMGCYRYFDPELLVCKETEYTLQGFWEIVTGKNSPYDESFMRSFRNKSKKWEFVRFEHGKIFLSDPKNNLRTIRKELKNYVDSE